MGTMLATSRSPIVTLKILAWRGFPSSRRSATPKPVQTTTAIMLTVFGLCTLLAVVVWTGFGVALRRLLGNPRHARIFNVAMGLLLVASIVPMVT